MVDLVLKQPDPWKPKKRDLSLEGAKLTRVAVIARGETAEEDTFALVFRRQDHVDQFALTMSGRDAADLIKALCAAQRPTG